MHGTREIQAITRNPREGWAADSQRFAEVGDDALVWLEFGNQSDRSTRLNSQGNWPTLGRFEHQETAMTTMILSGKRQVVLPAVSGWSLRFRGRGVVPYREQL